MQLNKKTTSLIFSIMLFLILCVAAWKSLDFRKTAMYFPLTISLLGISLLSIDIMRNILHLYKDNNNREPFHNNLRALFKYTLIILCYFPIVYLLGIKIGTLIYLFLFLMYITRLGFVKAIVSAFFVTVALNIFGSVFNLQWPSSLLSNIFPFL